MIQSRISGSRLAQAGALFAAALATPAAIAFACTPAGTLDGSLHSSNPGGPSEGLPGQTIQFSGSSWYTDPNATPVRVYWDAVDGTAIWIGRPTTTGDISLSMVIPDEPPGDYFVGAVQELAGKDKAIARYPFTIPAPQASSTATGNPPPPGGAQPATAGRTGVRVPSSGVSVGRTARAPGHGSVARQAAGATEPAVVPAGLARGSATTSRSATGDLWSGFGPDRSGKRVSVATAGAGSQRTNGVLLAGGLVSLGLGLATGVAMLALGGKRRPYAEAEPTIAP